MCDVVLGQSYYLRFDPKLWKAMEPYPPLGTLNAAACLRRSGFDVAVFDAMLAASTTEWEAELEARAPRWAVLFEDNFNYLSKMCLGRMREAAFTMIGAARDRGCTVVVCGSDATDHAQHYLNRGADFVIIGEGEETLVELLESSARTSNGSPSTVQGLAFLDDAGNMVRTPARSVMKDLDDLPMPAWDLVDLGRYREVWRSRHGFFSLNLVTSRGCPFHCNWCAKPIWGQRYNARSPERVVEEMQWLKELAEPDHYWFMDDIMGIQPGWMERFADLVADRGVRTPFKSLNRVDLLLRDGEIDALRRAGCEIVWTGVESGSQSVLDAMEKGIQVEQVHEAARRLHEAGIRVGFFLQFGYPGETRADIERTFDLVRRCRPDQIGVSVSYPLPGTPFYDRVRQQLGEQRNWVDSEDLAMMYRGPFTTSFYRRLHTALHKEFRMRKAARELRRRLGNREVLHEPASIGRGAGRSGLLRETAALVYHAATLPVARLQMELASHRSHDSVGPLPGTMTREEAAVPAPQEASVS